QDSALLTGSRGERPRESLTPLREQPTNIPEPAQSEGEPDRLVVVRSPIQRRPQVGVFHLQPCQPFALLWATQIRLRFLRALQEKRAMSLANCRFSIRFAQLFAGILAYGL